MAKSRTGAIANIKVEHALDTMSDAFILLDREYRVAYVNPAAELVVRARAEDLVGRSHWDLWPASIGTAVEHRYRAAMETGIPQHFQNHYSHPDLDIWVDLHAYPREEGLAVYFRDITAHVLAQQEAARVERAYKAALSNTPDLVYVFDLDHRFTYANEALLAMWGRSWDDAIGKNCLELGYPDWHAAMHDREIEQVVATKKPIRGEVPFHGTQGRRIYDYIFVPVLGLDGEVESVAGTTRDITDRKRAEEALLRHEKLAIAGRLATSIAHEINNPLEAVTNLLYLIDCDPTLAPQTREYLDIAKSELNRVSHIAAQTLRFYRQNTGPTPVQLHELLDSVASLYDRRLRDAQIAFIRDYGSQQPILAFAGELRQVVANLVGNALDAVPPGGRITLRERPAFHSASGRKGTRITVADTGHGMSADTVSRIFEPFFSTKTTTGTGLGLWITREIVEKHGGRIRVRSSQRPSRAGTVFTVFLPHLEPAERGDRTTENSPPAPTPSPSAAPSREEEPARSHPHPA